MRLGMAAVGQWAAWAARMPFFESSMTRQSSGGSSNRLMASR